MRHSPYHDLIIVRSSFLKISQVPRSDGTDIFKIVQIGFFSEDLFFIDLYLTRKDPSEIKNIFFQGSSGQDGPQHQLRRTKQTVLPYNIPESTGIDDADG